nr:Chain E, Telomeric repeat-binding factor 2-interacting protein 1 [Homo sapiens]4RQI_F Chain F, Telomeric repeat-binding factor 2-interacting protein 1 [Homo sapiens]4RQI_G Chain G, Telomeric repeat-binding factor 2-interacting protein 1 [Homo sapiens]4RQI_H Chain H, Telomeric repeat-binding factor 2-interacting protein 1 [Homo sapiens]
ENRERLELEAYRLGPASA